MHTTAGRIRHVAGLVLVALGTVVMGVAHFQGEAAARNLSCADFALEGQTWRELKIDDFPVADPTTASDGTLTVTISGFTLKDGDPNEILGIDFTANLGIDAVYVKAASDKQGASVLYRYDPPGSEVTAGDDLLTAGKHAISHVSFCYDTDTTTTSTSTSTTSTSTTTSTTSTSTTTTTTTAPEDTTTTTGPTVTTAGTTAPPTTPPDSTLAPTSVPGSTAPHVTGAGTTLPSSTAPTSVTLPHTGNHVAQPLAITGFALLLAGLVLLLVEHEIVRRRMLRAQ